MGYECFDVAVDDQVAYVRMVRPDTADSVNSQRGQRAPELSDVRPLGDGL